MGGLEEKSSIKREDAIVFIGENSSFYFEKWGKHADGALKGWNWAAALFGIEWMAYRKMYVEAVLSYIVVSLLSVAFNLEGTLWGYCFRIMFGLFGNALYHAKAMRALHKVDILSNSSDRLCALSRRGGTSVAAVLILIMFEIVLAVMSFAS